MTSTENTAQAIALLESLAIPALFFRHDGIIQWINESAGILFQRESALLQGGTIDELEGFDELRILLDTSPLETEICQVGPGRYCQVRLQPVGDEGVLVVLHDVTEFHEREKYQRDAMHMVAHDLKTPISVIKSYTDLISQLGELNPQQKQFMERILIATENMTRLVRDLLDLTWIDTNAPLEKQATRLAYIAQNAIDSLHTTAQAKQIELVLDYTDDLPQIQADPNRLGRVASNLLSNAIKYSPEGSQVIVRVHQANLQELCLTVSDHGVGIGEEYLPRIFERFYRAPRSGDDDKFKGSGLGLAIVHAIVEKHGGRIEVESRIGEGTSFYVFLPV